MTLCVLIVICIPSVEFRSIWNFLFILFYFYFFFIYLTYILLDIPAIGKI